MLQTINYLRLSRTDSDEISVIEAKQGDNQGDICQIEIYDNQDIIDLSQFDDILFTANKPDMSSVLFRLSDGKNLIKNNNTLSLTFTSALLSMHGTVECELSFYKNDIVKSTYNFNIYVFKSPGSFDELNNSDLSTIKEAVKTVINIGDAAKISAENAKKSEENAKESENNALNSANTAEVSANIANEKANEASASAIEAKKSEDNAKTSEIASSNSESNALSSANAAKISEKNSKESENKAKTSETNAKNSENVANNKAQESKDYALLSQSYAIGGTNSRENEDIDNAKYYSTQSKISSDNALNSASNAYNSEQNCLNSENNSLQYSKNAKLSEENANSYASQASISASMASDKADIAISKASEANSSADKSLEYANKAKEYKDKCLQISQGLEGALIPIGTIPFEDIPIDDVKTGYMYNISNEFTSDERFKDGVKTYPAGTNIYYTQDGKWDVLMGDLDKYVFKTDFKEHKDDKSNPHNVTKGQVGLGNVPNVVTNDQTVTYSDANALATLSSGEKISIAFGKIKKAISELILHLKDGVKHVTSDERTLWNTVKNKADTNHTHGSIDDGANSWTATEIRKHFEGKAEKVHTHTIIVGQYTGSGGRVPPSYVGANAVKCNMMNGFEGLNTPNLSGYMDVLMMNAYSWNDVPYTTALGIKKGNGGVRAWIANGGNTSSWSQVAELLTSANYTEYAATKVHSHAGINDGSHSLTATEIYDYIKDLQKKLSNNTLAIVWDGKSFRLSNYIGDNMVGYTLMSYNDNIFYSVNKITMFKDSDNILFSGEKGNFIVGVSVFSDARLKKNVKRSKLNAIECINEIEMCEYDFIDEKYGEHSNLGYIAQQLQKVIPECVVAVPQNKEQMGYDELLQVQDTHLIPYLVKAIQELSSKVAELEKKIDNDTN